MLYKCKWGDFNASMYYKKIEENNNNEMLKMNRIILNLIICDIIKQMCREGYI